MKSFSSGGFEPGQAVPMCSVQRRQHLAVVGGQDAFLRVSDELSDVDVGSSHCFVINRCARRARCESRSSCGFRDVGLFLAGGRAVSVRQLIAKVQALETPCSAALGQGLVYDLVVFLFCFDKEFELFGCQESQFLSEFTKNHFAVLLFVTNTNDLLCC